MATGVEYDYPDWVKELAEEEQRLQWLCDTNVFYNWCAANFVHRAFDWSKSRQWYEAWYQAKRWNYNLLRSWVDRNYVKPLKDRLLTEEAHDDFSRIKWITPTTIMIDEAIEYFESKKPKISRLTFL